MAGNLRWWAGIDRERFWVEATDRADIGANLRAPLVDISERDNWRYSLFREATAGDVIFHYDANRSAIVGASRVSGPTEEQPILWAARGTYATRRGAEPQEVPGYLLPLSDYQALPEPLTLNRLREAALTIRDILGQLKARHGTPLFFPFELSARPLRPMQGYAFKLPADFVTAFPQLHTGLTASEKALLRSAPVSGQQAPGPGLGSSTSPLLRFERGITEKPSRWATASLQERELNIHLRHNEMQERLRDRLVSLYGSANVRLEVPIGDCLIDAVVRSQEQLYFYEVKAGSTVRACVREAIGQLLEYALWPGSPCPTRLVVVGESVASDEDNSYLERLNARFPIPLEYESCPLTAS